VCEPNAPRGVTKRIDVGIAGLVGHPRTSDATLVFLERSTDNDNGRVAEIGIGAGIPKVPQSAVRETSSFDPGNAYVLDVESFLCGVYF